jgi:hypothetical protein
MPLRNIFLKWMYGMHMAAVIQILGPHAHCLR